MKITLNMILTRFFINFPDLENKEDLIGNSVNLKGVRYLPNYIDDYDFNYLYMCDATHSILKGKIPKNLILICVNSDKKNTITAKNVIVLNTNIEFAILINKLQDIYIFFHEWNRDIDISIIKNKGIQHLVDISSPIINNPIIIYDPSLKIIAYSKDIQLDDNIYTTVTEKGYIPPEYVSFFEQENIFSELNNKGAKLSNPYAIREHEDFVKLLRIHDEIVAYCIIILADYPNKPYITSLFNILCDNILQFLKLSHESVKAERYMYEYFIIDLLEDNYNDESTVKSRLQYIDIPYKSNFYLLKFSMQDDSNAPEKYLVHAFAEMLPNARVFVYDDSIIALYTLNNIDFTTYKNYFDKLFNTISTELKRRKIFCIISKCFHKITDIRIAYLQIKEIQYFLNDKKLYYYYEDYWIFHLLAITQNRFPLLSFCEPVILEIQKQFAAKGVNQLKILEVYLKCDRQMTKAAEKLHMHRNNVIYHIKQLEMKYNLDFEDEELRLKLLVSFKILEWIGYTK